MDEELKGILEEIKDSVNTIKKWITFWGIAGIILALIYLLNSCASGY